MKVQCPSCLSQVPAVNVDLDSGWGKCDRCQEVFQLAEVFPGFRAAGTGRPIQRPFNARAILGRTAEELFVHLPPEGMRAGTLTLLVFATFWLGFIAVWTLGAVELFGGQQPGVSNWLFASFSIPFWLAGFGIMATVAWNVWGTKSLELTRDGLKTSQRCLVWSRSRSVEFEQVQRAQSYDPQVKTEGERPHAVEVVYFGGSFVLPADSKAEEQWLITEINDFLGVGRITKRAM
jgi:hypothetical protein